MPVYDRLCTACDWATDFALEPVRDPRPACPACGGATVRAYIGRCPSVIRDEFITPLVDDIMDVQTQVFRTKSEHRAAMKARGLTLKESHVPAPGSDRSSHTSRWDAAIDLRAAEDLVRRHYSAPAAHETPTK
jgi:hypothetical protein